MASTSVVVRELSATEIAAAQERGLAIAAAGSNAPPVPTAGRFTFFAAFDGTRNNRDNLAMSGDSQDTNVGQMELRVQDAIVASGAGNVRSRYYEGIGADGSAIDAGLLPTSKAIEIAEKAYTDTANAAIAWLERNPGQPVQVMMTTASRGDGVGAIYSHLLYERGIVNSATGEVLVAPGAVRIAGLVAFDPVTTLMNGNLRYAPIVDNAVVVFASDENRSGFRATDRAGETNFFTVNTFGNHGDVIGFYDNALGALTMGGTTGISGATGYFINRGLPILPVEPGRLYNPNQPAAVHTEAVNSVGVSQWPIDDGLRQTQTAGGASATQQVLPDGSTYSDFTDYAGQRVTRTVQTNPDNSTTEQVKITYPGVLQLRQQTQVDTSPDGNTKTYSTSVANGPWVQTVVVRTALAGGGFNQTSRFADGRIVSSDVSASGALLIQDVTTPKAFGTETIRKDAAGQFISSTTRQTDDDGNLLEIITNADGSGTAKAFDSNNQLINESTFQRTGGSDGTAGTTAFTLDGVQQSFTSAFSLDAFGAPQILLTGFVDGATNVNAALADLDINAKDLLLARGEVGAITQLANVNNPGIPGGIVGQPDGTGPTGQPLWYDTAEAQRLGGLLTDLQCLVAAFKTGKPLPIASSFFSLVAHQSRYAPGGGDSTLDGLSGALTGLSSLGNLSAAFNRGDPLGVANSGLAARRAALGVYQSVLGAQVAAQYGSIAAARFAIDEGDELALELVGEFDAVGSVIGEIA